MSLPPNDLSMNVLGVTQSLCPVCLRRIDAEYREQAHSPHCVWLVKTCPDHGNFCVPVWDASHGGPTFATWSRPKTPSHPTHPGTATRKGCPYDCGLCPEHGQHTCTGLVEVTQRCSMGCPVCYASAGKGGNGEKEGHGGRAAQAPAPSVDPSLSELEARFDALHRASAGCNVQLSGGEPTERDDLPRIVALARGYSFGLLQLNTNGRRLAREPEYAATLRAAGLDSVYLQWDGVSDATFQTLRGQRCLAWKQEALQHCLRAGLGVVLVATVVRGVNDGEMGDLVRLALAQGPGVRGVHFQPMAAFGRCPWTLEHAPRFTLPEVVHALERQAPELIQAGQLHPPSCEHALCSCSAVYRRVPMGQGAGQGAGQGVGLECIPGGGCCEGKTASPGSGAVNLTAAEGARKATQFTALHWRGAPAGDPVSDPTGGHVGGQNASAKKVGKEAGSVGCCADMSQGAASLAHADAFSRFVAAVGVEQRFTVSAMAFQDALSLDLDRVRGCCIHVVADDGRLVPFCAYNLTSQDGVPLHRKPAGAPR